MADACVAAATLFKPQELANLIYAVAIAGCWGEARLVAALERAVVGVPWSEWKVFELRSLALVQYHAKAEAGLELFRDDATFDTVLENARLSADVTVSRTQAEVSQLLGDLGWAHDDEVEVEGVLSVDMADVAARTAVEFDGPSHFVTELETGAVRVGGATLAKTRVLRALGWMVVRLRYDDWQRECEAGTAESFLTHALRRGFGLDATPPDVRPQQMAPTPLRRDHAPAPIPGIQGLETYSPFDADDGRAASYLAPAAAEFAPGDARRFDDARRDDGALTPAAAEFVPREAPPPDATFHRRDDGRLAPAAAEFVPREADAGPPRRDFAPPRALGLAPAAAEFVPRDAPRDGLGDPRREPSRSPPPDFLRDRPGFPLGGNDFRPRAPYGAEPFRGTGGADPAAFLAEPSS